MSGAVHFTIKVHYAQEGKERTSDWSCAKPIIGAVGATAVAVVAATVALPAAALGGAAGSAMITGSTLAMVVSLYSPCEGVLMLSGEEQVDFTFRPGAAYKSEAEDSKDRRIRGRGQGRSPLLHGWAYVVAWCKSWLVLCADNPRDRSLTLWSSLAA